MVAAMSASAAPSDGVGEDQHPAPAPTGPVTEQFKSSLAREETNPATAAAECGVEAVAGLVEAAQLVEKETMPEIEISYIQYKDERLF